MYTRTAILITLVLLLAAGCGGQATTNTPDGVTTLDGKPVQGWTSIVLPGENGATLTLSGVLTEPVQGLILPVPQASPALADGPVWMKEENGLRLFAGETEGGVCLCLDGLESSLPREVELNIPLGPAREVAAFDWPEYSRPRVWRMFNGNVVRWHLEWLRGDGNMDGVVDGKDLLPLALYFGKPKHEGTGEFRPDYNEDGRMDGGDLFSLALNFNERMYDYQLKAYDDEQDTNGTTVVSYHFNEYFDHGYLDPLPRGGFYKLHWYDGDREDKEGSEFSFVAPRADMDYIYDNMTVEAERLADDLVRLNYSFLMSVDPNSDREVDSIDLFPILAYGGWPSGLNGTEPPSHWWDIRDRLVKCDLDYNGYIDSDAERTGDLYLMMLLIKGNEAYHPRVYTQSMGGGIKTLLTELNVPSMDQIVVDYDGVARAYGSTVVAFDPDAYGLYFTYTYFPAGDRDVGDQTVREARYKQIPLD